MVIKILDPIESMIILLLTFLIIPFMALIIISIWVYSDAKKNDLNAVVWILVLWLIPFFIGFILYLFERNKFLKRNS